MPGSYAGTDNIAPKSKVTASTYLNDQFKPENVTDGLIGIQGVGEWACEGVTTDWGYIRFPWIQLDWDKPQAIDRIVLFDRPSHRGVHGKLQTPVQRREFSLCGGDPE